MSANQAVSRGPTVLVIEDDAPVRDGLVKVLERDGFVVTAVADASSALDRVRRTRFDAIICDIKLPGMTGDEFYRALKKRNAEAAGRVLFITAYQDERDVHGFLEITERPFLSKPFDVPLFTTIVREIAEGRY
jgi:CheY-like chemotaxis protein